MGNTCVCCGKYAPEGRQTCLECENSSRGRRDQSETLVLGYDHGYDGEISSLCVSRMSGTRMVIVNIFYGEEAEKMHSLLTAFRPNDTKFWSNNEIRSMRNELLSYELPHKNKGERK